MAARAQLSKLEQQPRPEELPPSAAKVRTAAANVQLCRSVLPKLLDVAPPRLREALLIAFLDRLTR